MSRVASMSDMGHLRFTSGLADKVESERIDLLLQRLCDKDITADEALALLKEEEGTVVCSECHATYFEQEFYDGCECPWCGYVYIAAKFPGDSV